MGLLVLRRVFGNLALGVIYREQVAALEKLIVDLAHPLGRFSPVDGDDAVVVGAAVPRLHKVRFHALGPLFQRYVTNQRSNRHTCPHRTAMHVGLATVVGLAPCEDQLKRQTPIRHRGNRNSQRMDVLAVVVLVAVGELFSHPTLEVWDVAYKIHLAPGQEHRSFSFSAPLQPSENNAV